MSAPDLKFQVIAGYRFFDLVNPEEVKPRLWEVCKGLQIVGTIILSPEGINCYAAGSSESIESLKKYIHGDLGFPEIEYKEHESSRLPYRQMIVKVKPEIITMGVPDIRPAEFTAENLSPLEFKKWLDEKRDITVIDTRNNYEVELGKFSSAIDLGIRTFRQFPQKISELPKDLKEKPVVMYCTGGIRCEKASALALKHHGFKKVYQLQGGILKYFKEVGGDHYDGECLVFDRRVGLNSDEVETTRCVKCSTPLSDQDFKNPKFIPFERCPHCQAALTCS